MKKIMDKIFYAIMSLLIPFTGWFLWDTYDFTWFGWLAFVLLIMLWIYSIAKLIGKAPRDTLFKRSVLVFYLFLTASTMYVLPYKLEENEYVISASRLNVRKGPGKQYPVIGKLSRFSTVKVIETVDKNWAVVDKDGQKGFVAMEYLRKSEGGSWIVGIVLWVVSLIIVIFIVPNAPHKVFYDEGLTIYKDPGNKQVKKVLPKGAKFRVLDTNEEENYALIGVLKEYEDRDRVIDKGYIPYRQLKQIEKSV